MLTSKPPNALGIGTLGDSALVIGATPPTALLIFPSERRGTEDGEFMSDPVVESLMLDLLEWISTPTERTYDEVMDAWRASCPRLQVWEDASDLGLVTTEHVDGRNLVKLTAAGLAHLAQRRTG